MLCISGSITLHTSGWFIGHFYGLWLLHSVRQEAPSGFEQSRMIDLTSLNDSYFCYTENSGKVMQGVMLEAIVLIHVRNDDRLQKWFPEESKM